MADKNASLKLPDGRSLDFPVLSGTTGPDVVDIRTLYGKSGMFTYDPGYLSTASGFLVANADEREESLRAVRELATRYGERFPLPKLTYVFVFRRLS